MPLRKPPFGLGTSDPPRHRRQDAPRTLRRLIGGPLDGKVAETSGRCPCLLLSDARDADLLTADLAEARWNAETEWYEVEA